MDNTPQTNQWKEKIKEILGLCQKEIHRTKDIGAQMLTASKINSDLNLNYQKLGSLLFDKIKNQGLSINDEEINKLIEKAEELKEKLSFHEEELKRIKHSKD